MQVKLEEDPRLSATPVPAGYQYIAPNAAVLIRTRFSAFEQAVVNIRCNLKKDLDTIDDFKKYEEWQHAFSAQSDGQGSPRKAWQQTILEWKTVNVNGTYSRTPVLGKRKKSWINEPRVCSLLPGDSWGDCEDTKNLFLDRTERSSNIRKTKKRGNLQLLFSKPSYPDPFVRKNEGDPLRPPTVTALTASAWKSLLDDDYRFTSTDKFFFHYPDPVRKVSANDEVFGPPREEASESVEMGYNGSEVLGCTLDYIHKLSLMKELGHAEVATTVPLVLKQRGFRTSQVRPSPRAAEDLPTGIYKWEPNDRPHAYIAALASPEETEARLASDLGKCTTVPTDDERYRFHWRQHYSPREQDPYIEKYMKRDPLKKDTYDEKWQFMRMMSRQKKYHRWHRTAITTLAACPRTELHQEEHADPRLRGFWAQYVRGMISAKELLSAESRLGSLSKLLEDRKHLPVAVGKPSGDFSREEKISMVRLNMTHSDIQRYTELKDIYRSTGVPEAELDSVDVMTANAVCRALGDGEDSILHGEYIPKDDDALVLPDSARWSDKLYPGYTQLGSGIWVPKRLMDWRNYKDSPVDIPEIAVKSDEGLGMGIPGMRAKVPRSRNRFNRFRR